MNDDRHSGGRTTDCDPEVPPLIPDPSDDSADRFGSEYKAMENLSALDVLEALLKRPARLIHEITHGHGNRVNVTVTAITTVCMVVYGIIMGTFSGGDQLWAVPAKVVAGLFLAATICLPSLYIFSCLGGTRLSFGDVLGLLLLALALTSVLLLGLAPVTWIFSQSTEAPVFMGVMHLAFWGIGLFFGFRLLCRAFGFLDGRGTSTLKVWGVIFVAVTLQMTSTLRPLVGPYEGPALLGKKCFLSHWSDEFEPRHPGRR